ncbi:hypothetical protein NLU13_5038 [Sarocladium strictum]|uniref:Zn(2)-C6 fungal-type domain-containing protein n=1 Tax=Sarocladium strictum TaxID=5046 RepID=A0AA39GK07_SARSR|nr:hypothetical protein NLU13_5038 [Sarocladium strictum]
MAPGSSDNASVSGARAASRVVGRQACDGCRMRKRRCTFKGDDGVQWINGGQPPDGTPRCQNCDKAKMQCTFLLPLKPRGPKPRGDNRYLSFQSASSSEHKTEWDGDLGDGHSQSSSGLQRFPSNTSQHTERIAFAAANSSIGSASPMQSSLPYATDVLFPRDLVRFVLRDYITYIYPLIPVIHIPTFEVHFDQEHDTHNQEFFLLIISLCALTIGLLPSRFAAYREFKDPLPFESRTEAANHCYKLNQGLRDIEYWDTVSHQKWASSYLLALAFHQIGNVNLWRMLEVEAIQLLRLLEVQHSSSYVGLDPVEVQLRKKAFWLMFYAYVHQSYSYRHERVGFLDPFVLQEIKLEELMPAPVDDEYITPHEILPCPDHVVAESLTTGFNVHSLVFSAALAPNTLCSCPLAKDPEIRLARLEEQLHTLRTMLSTVEPAYRTQTQLQTALSPASEDDGIRSIQREVIRANIETTRLWLQIMILDKIEITASGDGGSALSPARSVTQMVSGSSFPTVESLWSERERVCQELIHAIHSFSRPALEPNGNALVYKLRDVAVSFLACPEDVPEDRARRVRGYLGEFSKMLSVLDVSEMVNTLSLQSWIDTSRSKALSSHSGND